MSGEITLTTELGNMDFVAGDYITLGFVCKDFAGVIINLNSATCTMKLCPYGQQNLVTLTKTGTITSTVNGTFEVYLLLADTKDLFGVYQAQPQVVDILGRTFLPGNIILNISARIN